MASRKLSDAHIILQEAYTKAKKTFEEQNPTVKVILTATYRSKEEQDALYNQPRDKKDNDGDGKIDEANEKVTNAKGLQSPHNYLPSMAIDVAFTVNGKVDWSLGNFKAFAKLMKSKSITWGGDFRSLPDAPHFELSNWKGMLN